MLESFKNTQYPTKLHGQYIEYMTNCCEKYGLSLLLEGSLAKNMGHEFSDLDLAISGDISREMIDTVIGGYDSLVMTNYTENPKGIWILNYKNGINVDLDIRTTFLPKEMAENVVLCNNGFIIDSVVRRADIKSSLIPERPQWYKTMRLIHRCCLKWLCEKEELSRMLSAEVQQAILDLYDVQIQDSSIRNQMKEALAVIDRREKLDKSIIRLFDKLFLNMQA